MEVEMLIAAVRQRRPIWDATIKLHSNRDCIKKLWEEIAIELGLECNLAKKKWKALRENYRKEQLKKRTTTGQAAGDTWKSKWVHFEDLSFLQDQFVPRMMSGNMSPGVKITEPSEEVQETPDDIDDTIVEEHEVDKNFEEAGKSLPAPGTSTNQPEEPAAISVKRSAPPVRLQRTKQLKTSLLQKMVQLEERKVQQYEQRRQTPSEVQDADYYFLMSLLPSMRAIPPNRKMLFRRKVEDLFLQEEEHSAQMNFSPSENQLQRSYSVASYDNSTSATEHSDTSTNVGQMPDDFHYDERTISQLIGGYEN